MHAPAATSEVRPAADPAVATSAPQGMPTVPADATTGAVDVATGAGAGEPRLGDVLARLGELLVRLQGVVAALPAATQDGAPGSAPAPAPAPTPAAPTGTATPGPAAADATRGFTVTGDAAERAALGAALDQVGSTAVGSQLLDAVRDRGVVLDIATDAEYDSFTGGRATGSIGVFAVAQGKPPTVLMRASALAGGDVGDTVRVLAHELSHAAQHLAGEGAGSYARALGAAAGGVNPAALATGDVVMREAGAELVATATLAELQDPARFRQVLADDARAAENMAAAAAASWEAVDVPEYNAAGHQLAPVTSPTAAALVQAAVAAS